MARTLKDAALGSRASRERLAVRSKPYYRSVLPGLHIGYYKGSRAGTWIARRTLDAGKYQEHRIGLADDIADADGLKILSFGQAQEAARLWFSSGAAGEEPLHRQPRRVTIADALAAYLTDYKRRGGKSVERLEQAIRAHIISTLGSVEIWRLTRRAVEDWLDNLVKTPPRLRTRRGAVQQYREASVDHEALRRRRSTANRILTILKAALNYAYDQKMVTSKAAWDSVKAFRNVEEPRVRYLTEAEIHRFLRVIPSPFRELALAALLTGMRYGELASARAQDFDSHSATIHVPRSKSGKSRHVHLTDEGTELFSRLSGHLQPNDLIFRRGDGRPWGESHQHRWMVMTCKAAGIHPLIGFHILRHTYASRLAMRGVPLNAIAEQLGHADTRMTEKHYAHLAPSYLSHVIRQGFGRIIAEPKDGAQPDGALCFGESPVAKQIDKRVATRLN